MKVAMLAPEFSPSWGGVGSYTYNLVNNLPEDVELHIISIDWQINDSYEDLLLDKGIKIHKVTKISGNESFFYNLKFQIALFRKIRNLNDKYNFDLIHSHSGHLPHNFSQLWKLAPMIVTVHTETKGIKKARSFADSKKDRTEVLNDLFAPFISFSEKITFKNSDSLLPISQFTLNQINNDYGVNTDGRSKVIYNGVDTKLFRPKSSNNKEITILFAGRLYSVKGVDIFLNAFKIVFDKGYKIKLILAGRGDIEYVNNFLSAFPKDSFSICGRVSYQDMPQLYNKSDIVIVPSLYEGCSGTILEAMACNKIVIASDVGGTPEIIKDGYNGLLFESRNSLELANKIICIIEENFDIESIRKNGRETIINNFNWKDKADEVYNCYSKLLGSK